jgi:hypothetical protein
MTCRLLVLAAAALLAAGLATETPATPLSSTLALKSGAPNSNIETVRWGGGGWGGRESVGGSWRGGGWGLRGAGAAPAGDGASVPAWSAASSWALGWRAGAGFPLLGGGQEFGSADIARGPTRRGPLAEAARAP